MPATHRPPHTLRGLAGAILLALLPAAGSSTPAPEPPRPTEVAPGHDEERVREGRRAWFESLHRTAPNQDWREIERRNRGDLLARRQLLARSGAARATSPWTELGSSNQAGRVHQVAFDPDSNRLFLGSSLGGLWRGRLNERNPDPDGMNWRPISDFIYGGAAQVLLDPGSPEVLLKTFPEAYGGEIHRSSDLGNSWTVSSGIVGRPRRLVGVRADSGTHDAIFAVVDDPNHWWSGATTSRLYRSLDRGVTFHAIRDLGNDRGDVWTPRAGGSGELYLLSDARLEVSHDRGDTWATVGALPWNRGDARVALAASEAGSPTFYAVLEPISGSPKLLFRSRNGGASWTEVHDLTSNGFWGDFTSLAASTRDPDLVLYGGIDAFRSTNGGASFARINGWAEYYGDPAGKLHADITGFDFVPFDGTDELLLVSTDGGLYLSTDGGASVENLSLDGLRVSQYYSVLTDRIDESQLLAGSQDQGYQLGSSHSGEFDQLISGDYGQLVSNDGTHRLVHSVYPGFVLHSERSGGTTGLLFSAFPEGETHQWLPALAADPEDSEAFYFGATRVHRYDRAPGASTFTPTELPFAFTSAGGSPVYVTALAIAPTNGSRWYAGTSDGSLWASTNGGGSWIRSGFSGPFPHYLTGFAILVDPDDARTVTVGGSGYGNPAVFRSTNGGTTFSPLGSGLPPTLVFDLAGDPLGGGDLYAATEAGPWKYEASTGQWQSLLGLEAPITTYWAVEALSDRVRFATYGRGIWDYDPAPIGCSPNSETACLLGNRFEVTGTMTNAEGVDFPLRVMTFDGQRAQTDTTVFFESFLPGGVEYVFKLLDACGFTGSYWGFLSGTLTNQETAFVVRDTATGAVRTWGNAPGAIAPGFQDTGYFETCGAARHSDPASGPDTGSRIAEPGIDGALPATRMPGPRGTCTAGAETSCLLGGRFRVTGTMTNSEGVDFPLRVMTFGGRRAETETTVFLESFLPGGVEYVFKLLDACGFTGTYWGFLSGTLTNQATVFTVEDTLAGGTRTYVNPAGTIATGFQDTAYFDTCAVPTGPSRGGLDLSADASADAGSRPSGPAPPASR